MGELDRLTKAEREHLLSAGKIRMDKDGHIEAVPEGEQTVQDADVEAAQKAQLEQYLQRVSGAPPATGPQVSLDQLPPELQAKKVQELRSVLQAGSPQIEQFIHDQTSPEAAPTAPPADEPPAGKQEDKPADATPHECPNCQWVLGKDPVEVTDEDKAEWVRALLGDRPFTKTYRMLGDQYEVTFRTRSMAIEEAISAMLTNEVNANAFPNASLNAASAAYGLRMFKLQMAASFVRATNSPGPHPEIDSDEGIRVYAGFSGGSVGPLSLDQRVDKAHQTLFRGWRDPVYAAVYWKFRQFELLCSRLTEATSNSDFQWETAG